MNETDTPEKLARWIWDRYAAPVPSANWEQEYAELLKKIRGLVRSYTFYHIDG